MLFNKFYSIVVKNHIIQRIPYIETHERANRKDKTNFFLKALFPRESLNSISTLNIYSAQFFAISKYEIKCNFMRDLPR